MNQLPKTAADFFAGIGLVGAGLMKKGWKVKYAVDYDDDKRRMYEANFGKGHYHVKDVGDVTAEEVPNVTLIHASFPCTDTSLAGSRGGINNGESASFWKFIRVLTDLGNRKPPIVMLENVEGLLTSNDGEDINAVLEALDKLGYYVDLMLIDASYFVPQSRVRLFIMGTLREDAQDALQQIMILQRQEDIRPQKIQQVMFNNKHLNWYLQDVPPFPKLESTVADIVDNDAQWWSRERSEYLFNQMFERHKEKVRKMMEKEEWSYGTVFRRTRKRNGKRRSTAELRTDGVAGCLRTPKGGSARQILFRAGFGRYAARLINGRECARLMGVPNFNIDENMNLNQVLFGFGDAVCASVAEWLAEHYLNPTLEELSLVYANGRK